MTTKKRFITPQDLYNLQIMANTQLSPDGCHVVFSMQTIEQKTEKKFNNLWIVPTEGGETRQFTYGKQVDRSPKWSPDGAEIAFLSNRAEEKQPQIYIIPFNGGEARPLTDLKGEFGSFEWSPNGEQLVFAFRKKDQAAIDREEDPQKKELGIVEHHITRLFYKYDGLGFLPKERWHIWTVNIHTGKTKQLTEGDVYDELAPTWSPSGQEIAFISNRSINPDLNPDAVDLFIMPVDGQRDETLFSKLETPFGSKQMPKFSPDGQWLAYYCNEGEGNWWQHTHVWVVAVDGKSKAKNLTARYDIGASYYTINDLSEPVLTPPTWSADSQQVFFQVAHHGNTKLMAVSIDGENLQDVIADKGAVINFSFNHNSTKVAYQYSNLTDPNQVLALDLTTKQTQRLTEFNQPIMAQIDLGDVEEVWFNGAANNKLQGWIIKPPNFNPNKKYPSILEIHGGPWAQYGNLFMHEFYYLAAHGYVVYCCNPRGGLGYGEAHSKAIANDWGNADYADLMAWVDFMEQKPYIDKNRMGVTGGSYGGYMTTWIIGHTHRFKAAVAQRVVSNLISFYGSSDINWMTQHLIGATTVVWEDVENYWRQSPLKYLGNAKTPTLVIHSDQDLRCAVEQAEQIFVILKRLGVDTELIRFPDESHGLSRGGRTDRRIARLNHILRWFNQYLTNIT